MTLDELIQLVHKLRVENKLNYDVEVTISTDDFGILPVKSITVEDVVNVTNGVFTAYCKATPFSDTKKVMVLDID